MSDCEQLRQHYDAYALGALEGEERAEIDAHLKRGCPVCTAELERARPVLRQLGADEVDLVTAGSGLAGLVERPTTVIRFRTRGTTD